MGLFKQLENVRRARAQVALHRDQVATPAGALLARGYQYPLTTVGLTAGLGMVLGTLGVSPTRVPGVASFVGTSIADLIAQGARLVSELGLEESFFATGASPSNPSDLDDP